MEPKITFAFDNVYLESQSPLDYWMILLDVMGAFSIGVGDKILYTTELFPIVEFACYASKWASEVQVRNRDFSYIPLEADGEWIWIRKIASGWRIGSVFQNYEEQTVFSLENIKQALDEYIKDVDTHLQQQLHIDLQAFIHTNVARFP